MAAGERKFNFEPIKPKMGRVPNDFVPYVRLQKGGVMTFNEKTLKHFGIAGPTFMRLFQDVGKRALGFQFLNSVKLEDSGNKNKGYRLMTPKNYTGTSIAIVSIQSFLSQLSDVHIPGPKLFIEKYKDNDSYLGYGEIYYIKIPKGVKESE